MTISRRKLVGAAGLLPPFAAAFTLSSAVKASEPETSDAESCSAAASLRTASFSQNMWRTRIFRNGLSTAS